MTDYALFGNGFVAAEFLSRAVVAGSPPFLVVANAPRLQRDADRIRALADAASATYVQWSRDSIARIVATMQAVPSAWLLSVYFGHVIGPEVLAAVQDRAVNLHPSLLPWNRGKHTNVWPFVDGSQTGVTLHRITAEVDGGPILLQREVTVTLADTAASLYSKLEKASLDLLSESWPDGILAAWPGQAKEGKGSSHAARDFDHLREYVLDDRPDALDLFNLLRARSFPPHRGLTVRLGKAAVSARIELEQLGGAAPGGGSNDGDTA